MKAKECMNCQSFSSSPIQFLCGKCTKTDAVVGFDETCDSYVERGSRDKRVKIKTNLSFIEILEMACKPRN